MKNKFSIPLLILAAVIIAGAALRIAVTIPGWTAVDFPAAFERPDTPGYTAPARSLAFSGYYEGTGRAPGFPALLACCFRLTGNTSCRLPISLLLAAGIFSIAAVYMAARKFSGAGSSPAPALWAAALYAFNLTAVANAPMLLTDTLFGAAAAVQWYLFVVAWKEKKSSFMLWTAAAAAVGTLIRPINSVWILPLTVLIISMPQIPWRRKAITAAAAVMIFTAILLPWMLRNRAAGAGMVIDTNTGAMLHQNGAMLLAEVKNSDFETEKAALREEQRILFADKERFPDEKSREEWRMEQLKKLVLAHPFIWLKHHLNWHILLPDLPTFSELSGTTSPGRGTMGVLAKEGIFAAAEHYFAGQWHIFWIAMPLLLCTAVLYLAAGGRIICDIIRIRQQWFELLVIAAFAEYYFFLPGAITAPRYQLPALPLLCTVGGIWLAETAARLTAAAVSRKRERTPATRDPGSAEPAK